MFLSMCINDGLSCISHVRKPTSCASNADRTIQLWDLSRTVGPVSGDSGEAGQEKNGFYVSPENGLGAGGEGDRGRRRCSTSRRFRGTFPSSKPGFDVLILDSLERAVLYTRRSEARLRGCLYKTSPIFDSAPYGLSPCLSLSEACAHGHISWSSLRPPLLGSNRTNRSFNHTPRERLTRRTRLGTSSSGPSTRSSNTGRTPVMAAV